MNYSDFARKYPEHAKLKALDVKRELIQAFVDWLFDDSDFILCDDRAISDGEYTETSVSREQIMADFFEIQLDVIAEEKEKMYQEMVDSVQ